MPASPAKRLALILLAIAFLLGGTPGLGLRLGIAAAASQPPVHGHARNANAQATAKHSSHLLAAAGHAAHRKAPATDGGHARSCPVSCNAACAVVADHRVPFIGFAWFGVTFQHLTPTSSTPQGITHRPPLFPPIAA